MQCHNNLYLLKIKRQIIKEQAIPNLIKVKISRVRMRKPYDNLNSVCLIMISWLVGWSIGPVRQPDFINKRVYS